jgi:site-specific DNA-adenine methylase
MWSYYGAKTNIVDHYPPPKFDKIIEPFAGSARYALKYFDRDVLLVDKYDVIIKIWKWLQQCSRKDILKLPQPKQGETLNDYTFDCEEAKLLMGFIVQFGVATPGLTPSATKINKGSHSRSNFMNYTINRIASDLYKIKHWKIMLDSYEQLENESATHFIDPPYQFGGHKYKHSNKNIDYNHLAQYCQGRTGQTIVCENTKATWLPFTPMMSQHGSAGNNNEAIWSNYPTVFDNEQLALSL